MDPDDPHLHGWLHERLGRYLWMSADTQNALAAYQRAVELVPAEPPTRGRAAVLSGLSQMLMLSDRFEESETLAREAIAVAALVPDARSVEGHARCNLGTSLAYLGRLEEGITELREARRIAEEQFDDVDDISRAMVNLHSILFDHGRLAEAAEVALENVRVTETLGLQRRKGVWSRCDAAQVLLLLGRLDEAGQLLDEARQLQPQGIDAFRTDSIEAERWLRRGDVDRARTHAVRAESAGSRIIDPHLLAPLYATLIEVATWQRDDEAAARWSADGLSRLAHVVHPAHLAPVLAAAATAAVRADPPRLEDARALLDRAASMIAATTARGTPADVEVLAAEAELSGDVTAWRDVATAWEGLGEPYRSAYARLQLAEALLGTGAHRDEAAEHLGVATATARRIGADGLVSAGRGPRTARPPEGRGRPREPLPAHRPGGRGPTARRRRPQRPRDRHPAVHQPPHCRAARLEPAVQARGGPPQ